MDPRKVPTPKRERMVDMSHPIYRIRDEIEGAPRRELDGMNVRWISLEPMYQGSGYSGPCIATIGVSPESLALVEGAIVATRV